MPIKSRGKSKEAVSSPTEVRSRNMRKIRSTGMKPELAIRRLLYSNGYRYRLHRYDLPGRPDIVFSRRKKIVFVHGCFWHQHDVEQCKLSHRPKTNTSYWSVKLERNRTRDAQHLAILRRAGWSVFVVWECEIRSSLPNILKKLRAFLGPA